MEITPTRGPNCEEVGDLVAELLAAHPAVSRVAAFREPRGDVGVHLEVAGLDFDIWIDPA